MFVLVANFWVSLCAGFLSRRSKQSVTKILPKSINELPLTVESVCGGKIKSVPRIKVDKSSVAGFFTSLLTLQSDRAGSRLDFPMNLVPPSRLIYLQQRWLFMSIWPERGRRGIIKSQNSKLTVCELHPGLQINDKHETVFFLFFLKAGLDFSFAWKLDIFFFRFFFACFQMLCWTKNINKAARISLLKGPCVVLEKTFTLNLNIYKMNEMITLICFHDQINKQSSEGN